MIALQPAPLPRPRDAAGGRAAGVRGPRRALAAAVIGATALAAIASVVALFAPMPLPPSQPDAPAKAAVLRFYEAVDTMLHTGETSALDAVTTPDLTTIDAFGTGQGRRALAERLARLRAADPDLRLRVAEAVVDGDRSVVRLHPAGSRSPAAASDLPGAAQSTLWPPVDLIRLDGNRVAEIEAVGDAGVILQTLTSAPFGDADSPADVAIARVTFAAGAATTRAMTPAPVLVVVETGALHIRLDPSTSFHAIAGTTSDAPQTGAPTFRVLRSNDAIVVPRGVLFTLSNEASAPATALAASPGAALTRPGAVFRRDAALGEGGRTLARGWPTGVGVEPLPFFAAPGAAGAREVTAARLTLAPGVIVAPVRLSGTEMIAVEAGRLGIVASAGSLTAISGGPAPPQRANAKASGCGDAVALTAGQTAALAPGAVVALCNAGDVAVDVMIVAITPIPPATAG